MRTSISKKLLILRLIFALAAVGVVSTTTACNGFSGTGRYSPWGG